MQSLENIISLNEAAKISGYTQDYLGSLIRSGEMKGVKKGGVWFTTEGELNKYIIGQKNHHEIPTKESVIKKFFSHIPARNILVFTFLLFIGFSSFAFAYNKISNLPQGSFSNATKQVSSSLQSTSSNLAYGWDTFTNAILKNITDSVTAKKEFAISVGDGAKFIVDNIKNTTKNFAVNISLPKIQVPKIKLNHSLATSKDLGTKTLASAGNAISGAGRSLTSVSDGLAYGWISFTNVLLKNITDSVNGTKQFAMSVGDGAKFVGSEIASATGNFFNNSQKFVASIFTPKTSPTKIAIIPVKKEIPSVSLTLPPSGHSPYRSSTPFASDIQNAQGLATGSPTPVSPFAGKENAIPKIEVSTKQDLVEEIGSSLTSVSDDLAYGWSTFTFGILNNITDSVTRTKEFAISVGDGAKNIFTNTKNFITGLFDKKENSLAVVPIKETLPVITPTIQIPPVLPEGKVVTPATTGTIIQNITELQRDIYINQYDPSILTRIQSIELALLNNINHNTNQTNRTYESTSSNLSNAIHNLTQDGIFNSPALNDATFANFTSTGSSVFTHVPTLAHAFSPSWPFETSNVSDSSLYINPDESVADGNLLGLAVSGVPKFIVDAEGDIYGNNLILTGSTTTGATTVSDSLLVLGTFSQTGANTFSTGTGAVSLNGDTTLATGKNFSQVGTGTFSTGTGAVSLNGATTITGANTFTTGTGATTVNSTAWTFANDTNFALTGGVNGLSFDTDTLSIDSLNHRIGIGTTMPGAKLDVYATTDIITGSTIGVNNLLTANPTSASSASYYADFNVADYTANYPTNSGYYVIGSWGEGRNSGTATLENVVGSWYKANNTSSGTINDAYGMVGQARNSGIGTIVRAYGVNGAARNNSTGSITEAVGVYGDIINANATGVITNAYNIKAATPYSNAGTIQNLYGVYIGSQNPTGGGTIVNKWALYQAGATDQSYFAGSVGIGTTSPTSILSVGSTSQFQVNSTGAIVASTGITSTGTFSQTGANAFGTGTGAVSLNGATTVTGANTFSTGTGIVTFNNVSTNISSSSPVIDLTSATTLSINTVTNRPVTFGTGLVTIPNLSITNSQGNNGTMSITSNATTQTIFSITGASLTSGTGIAENITANADSGQITKGHAIAITDATLGAGGYTALSISATGAGVGLGNKYLLDMNPGANKEVVFDSAGAFRPTTDVASNTNTIGSPTFKWKNGYFDQITANNIAGVVISGATSSTSWTIGSTQTGDVNEAIIFQRNSGSGNASLQWNAGAGDLRHFTVNYPFNANYTVSDTSITPSVNLYSGSLVNSTTGGTQKLLSLTNTGAGTTETGIYLNNTGTATTALEIAGTWTNGILTNNNSINTGSGAITGGAGSFTTLTSSGASTIGTGESLTNTFGTGTAAANTFGVVGGTNAINGSTTILGTTLINSTGTSATTIGNSTGVLLLASGGTSSWTNTSGNLTIQTATSGTMTIDSAGILNLGTVNSTATNLGKSGTTLTISPTAWTATPTISGLITATSGITSNGVATFNNNISQVGTGTFSTGTGAVSLNGATTANTFSSSGATITGGTINNSTIGITTPVAGNFSTIGITTQGSGAFTTLTATSINNLPLSQDNTDKNVKVGQDAGLNLVAGAVHNTFLGYEAGKSGDGTNEADDNTAVGYQSLYSNTTGTQNTSIGKGALYTNTTGTQNIAIGKSSLYSNTTGNGNTSIGVSSLISNNVGFFNTAIGMEALYTNTSGSLNTANGTQSLYSNTIGSSNTANGNSSLYSNTTGTFNTGLGYEAGRFISGGAVANTTGDYNVFLGSATKALADDDQNEIVIGYNTTGNGSDTTTIGNISTLRTYLTGLNLKAGTAAVGTAPLKFTSGALLGTTEAGTIEFLTDAYYGTITTGAGTSTARKTFAFLESPIFTGTLSTGTSAVSLNGNTSVTGTNTFNVGTGLTTLGGNLTVTGTAWTATPTISGLATFTSGITSNGTLAMGANAITSSGTIGTASTTTFTGAGATFSNAIAANGGITFDSATDTVGAHTLSGTLDANTNILTNIGNVGTDFIASTGALTLAGVLTSNGGITNSGAISSTGGIVSLNDSSNYATNIGTGTSTGTITIGNATVSDLALNDAQWSITGAGVANFASVGAGTAGTGAFTTLSASTSVSSPIFQGISAATTFGNATYATTIAGSGLTISPTAWTATPTISGLATFTSGITSNGTLAMGANAITSSGTIGTASTTTFTGAGATFSSAIAANGGITFDNTTDTVGAHTLSGTLDANTNILTNIGNVGTDFIASTGALTLAGVLTSNGGITNSGAISSTGGIVSLNDSSNYATNIGTGTSTGTITIGNATVSDLALNDAQWSITGAGVANFASVGAGTAGTGAFTTLSASTSLLTPTLDTATAVAMNIGTATQTALTLGRVGAATTINGSTITLGSAPTFTGFTLGSVLYAGTAGILAQDNANFFYDATLKHLGLGTVTPTNDLSFGNNQAKTIWIENSAETTVGRALTLNAGSTVAGATADVAGGNLILNSGLGKGTGASSIIFQTGRTLTTGSTLQTLTTAMTILGSGNVGIGTTNPQAPLDVPVKISTAHLGNNSGNLLIDTASNAGDISFGASYMTIKAGGNVGIGTTAPGATLDIRGATTTAAVVQTIANTSGSYLWQFVNSGATTNRIVLYGLNNSGQTGIKLDPGVQYTLDTYNGKLAVGYDASTIVGSAVKVAISGSVGIGNVAPLSKLGITGNASIGATYGAIAAPTDGLIIEGNVGIGQTSPTARLSVLGADSLSTSFAANISGATGTGLVVLNNGNVGIGTTGPTNTLTIQSNSYNSYPTLGTAYGQFSITGLNNLYGLYQGVNNGNGNSWMQAMRADTATAYNLLLQPVGGNVGIGTTTPGTTLDVERIVADGSGGLEVARFGQMSSGGVPRGLSIFGADVSGTSVGLKVLTTSGRFYIADKDGTENLVILDSGNVGIGTTNPGANRLKIIGSDDLTTSFSLFSGGATTTGLVVRNDGNVGIGTTTPVAKLDVAGYISSSNNSGAPTSGNSLNIAMSGGIGYVTSYDYTGSAYLPLYLRGSTTIINQGNVGIGTTNPVSALNVAGTTGITWVGGTGLVNYGLATLGTAGTGGSLFINTPSVSANYSSGLGVYGTYGTPALRSVINISAYGAHSTTSYGSDLAFSTTKGQTLTEVMRMTTDGNVGIGTTAPAAKLDVVGTDSKLRIGSNVDDSGTLGILFSHYASVPSAMQKAAILVTPTGSWGRSNMYFALNSEATITNVSTADARMTILNNGNVGIGTTAPAGQFTVSKTNATGEGGVIAIQNVGAGIDTSVGLYLAPNMGGGADLIRAASIRSRQTTSGSYADLGFFTANSAVPTEKMTITTTGNVGIGTTNIASKLGVLGNLAIGGTYGALSAPAGGAIIEGNVGIGTTTPQVALDVVGVGKFGSTTDVGSIKLGTTGGGSMNFTGGTTLDFTLWDGSALTKMMVIKNNGNVGIGTTSPGGKLHIAGGNLILGPTDGTTAASLQFREGSTAGANFIALKAPNSGITSSVTFTLPATDGTVGQVLKTDAAGNLGWAANSGTGMANPLTNTGDLIYASNTASPSTAARLGIGLEGQCLVTTSGLPAWGACAGTAAAAGGANQIQYNNSGPFGASADFTWDDTSTVKTLSSLGTVAGAKISLALLNASSSTLATNELRIGNDARVDALSLLVNSSQVASAANYAYIYNRTTGASTGGAGPLIFGTTNTERMRIDASGNVGIGTAVVGSALLDIGTGEPTDATKGLMFGTDASANLYRSAAGTIKTDGAFVAVGSITGAGGAFTTLTSSGATTLGTGASSVNTIGSVTTPGALTLHGATSLDNTFAQTGANTFGTGTGAVSLNGATTVTGTNTFSTGTGAVSINGATTLISTFAQTGANTFSTGTGAISLNGATTVTGSNTFNVGTGTATFGGNLTVTGTTWTATPTISGLITATSGITSTGALIANGTSTFNNTIAQVGTGTFSTGTGAVSLNGDTTIATGKNFSQTGTGTFSTGTGAVSLNGATTVTGSNTFNTGTGAVSINGATTLISTFAQTGANTFSTGTGAVSLNGDTTIITGKAFTITNGTTGILGATSINTSGSNATNIGTGTNAGTITIGNVTTGDLALNDANWNITGAGAANFTSIGVATAGSGAFTTLTSSGATTLGTGASSVNTIGSATTPGALTLHGATSLDNTFAQTGANTFGTGTGAISLNGATTVTGSNTFNVGTGTTTLGGTLQVGNGSVGGAVARFTNSSGYCDINPQDASLICSSDINLKKNIVNIKDGIEFALKTVPSDTASKSTFEKLMTLTPVKYNWKTEADTAGKHVGFIAQEVEQVFPDLVFTDSVTGLKSVAFTNLIPYTIEAMQEMNLKVEDLSSLDTTKATSLGYLMKGFLEDVGNNVSDLYATVIHSEKVETKMLCVSDDAGAKTCIDKVQLDNLMASVGGAGGSSDGSSSSPLGGGAGGGEPVVEPAPEPAPEQQANAPADAVSSGEATPAVGSPAVESAPAEAVVAPVVVEPATTL